MNDWSCNNFFGITGRRIGSRRFANRLLSKVGEGWIESGMGMARYMGVLAISWNIFRSVTQAI